MRMNKNSLLKFMTIAAGCAAMLSVPVFATETTRSLAVFTSVSTSAAGEETVTEVSYSICMEAYDELAEKGIVSAETVRKMNEYSEKQTARMKVELSGSEAKDENGNWTANFEDGDFVYGGLEEMAAEGIITRQEKEKIEKYYQEEMLANMNKEMKADTERYISENIITKAVAEKMTQYTLEQLESNKGIIAGGIVVETIMADGGEDGVTILIGSIFDLDGMVKGGILTQAQKTAIEASDQNYYNSFAS